jgi:hypothetical protein
MTKTKSGVKDLSVTHPEIAKRFSSTNSDPVTNYSKSSSVEVLWDCDAGHVYSRVIRSQTRSGLNCSKCRESRLILGVNDLETLRLDLKIMWSENNPPMKSFSASSIENVEWICPKGHKFRARIRSMYKRIDPCHDCPKPIPFETSVASSEILMKIWSIKNSLDPAFVKLQSHSKAIWRFKDCGHEYAADVKSMYKRDGMCSKCSYGLGSSQEDFLASLIKKRYSAEIDQRVRILDGKEIDIFIPSLNKGVEFNGERWHTNAKAVKGNYASARDMHLWKLDKAFENNIDLVYVWSHDWAKHRTKILTALDNWIVKGYAPSEILLRLESLNDGVVCVLC